MVLARNMQVRARADAGLQLTWGSAIELKLIVFISFRNFAPWSLLIHNFKMNHKKLETQKYFFLKKKQAAIKHIPVVIVILSDANIGVNHLMKQSIL